MPTLLEQLIYLFVLALAIACVSWTVTKEDLFKEMRAWCANRCETATTLLGRKFFYPLTCGYCFSHYVTLLLLLMTRFHLLYPDWRGYVVAGFALVWVANCYASLFELVRLTIADERDS